MACPFCDQENVERQLILETALCNVLYNIRPKAKGHCMVIPKRHVTSVRELTPEELADVFGTVQQVSRALKELSPAGFNYGCNEGAYAGQSVAHFHFHILPRYEDDGIPEFHVFHRDPEKSKNMTQDALRPFVEEFRALLRRG